ncbi:hypothetical protein N7508_002267 [Penicillium antarcticum]|nr:uncharacterized protein N7508_002267 [Penicillium antarcticum]KAJ5317759.1 hypothetical protein N7508_002267 [Penicillium antarcticum]
MWRIQARSIFTSKSNTVLSPVNLPVLVSLHQHYALLASPEWQEITKTLTLISPGSHSDASSLTICHAMISEFSPNPGALGNGAPVTGTALYLTADPVAREKTWALWTGIGANVPGCNGVTDGWMVEPDDGYSPCFVVYLD